MSTDDQPRTALTVAEVAQRLGVPEPTVRGWLRRLVLPSVKVGGRRLILVRELERVLSPKAIVEEE